MAIPRPMPTTAFGAWLDDWFRNHPDKTLQAFGEDVAKAMGRPKAYTDGAVSQWISGKIKRPTDVTLRGIAAVTGTSMLQLETLLAPARAFAQEPAEPPPWAVEINRKLDALLASLGLDAAAVEGIAKGTAQAREVLAALQRPGGRRAAPTS